MEKEEKKVITSSVWCEVLGETFIVREGSPSGVVVHVCGSYKDL